MKLYQWLMCINLTTKTVNTWNLLVTHLQMYGISLRCVFHPVNVSDEILLLHFGSLSASIPPTKNMLHCFGALGQFSNV
jgi:hypothetical protein